jgi:hypothetical protein
MTKTWDLSPVDQSSFDPFEPPGRPVTPVAPVNVAPPAIVSLGGLLSGDTLAGQGGSWSGTPTPTLGRQWTSDGMDLDGETAPGYVLADEDIGAMIGLRVVGTNSAGSATAEAEAVGPILPAP